MKHRCDICAGSVAWVIEDAVVRCQCWMEVRVNVSGVGRKVGSGAEHWKHLGRQTTAINSRVAATSSRMFTSTSLLEYFLNASTE